MLRAGNEPEQAEQMAALSVEELRQAAKQALIEVYELNEEQAAWTYLLDDDEYDELTYTMFHGIPCLACCYGVGDDEAEKDLMPNGIQYSDKEGTYWIYVNVQTGETVEIFYTAGIGGNG